MIYGLSYKARVFILGNSFQSSLTNTLAYYEYSWIVDKKSFTALGDEVPFLSRPVSIPASSGPEFPEIPKFGPEVDFGFGPDENSVEGPIL